MKIMDKPPPPTSRKGYGTGWRIWLLQVGMLRQPEAQEGEAWSRSIKHDCYSNGDNIIVLAHLNDAFRKAEDV